MGHEGPPDQKAPTERKEFSWADPKALGIAQVEQAKERRQLEVGNLFRNLSNKVEEEMPNATGQEQLAETWARAKELYEYAKEVIKPDED